jgi:hypothetical protein
MQYDFGFDLVIIMGFRVQSPFYPPTSMLILITADLQATKHARS